MSDDFSFLEDIPIIGGCLNRAIGTFMAVLFFSVGSYMALNAGGKDQMALYIGVIVLCYETSLLCFWGMTLRRPAKKLALVWFLSVAGFLAMAAVIAAIDPDL